MVLRTALESVRHEQIVASSRSKLIDSVNAYLDAKDARTADLAEVAILNELRDRQHIGRPDTAYIEPGCREHDVVHVNYDFSVTERGHWIEITRNGAINHL